MKRPGLFLVFMCFCFISCGGSGKWEAGDRYALIAWNDLGMHCMDHDYSVFAILPPYNNLRAQLVDRYTGKLASSDVVLTYEATEDTRGSINTSSGGKTNFWQWVYALFGASPETETGLAGNPAPGRNPAPMTYDASYGFWKAEGIPITPYDDSGNANYYPMVRVVAKDRSGTILAVTTTVLPVSDEMTCTRCHSSDTGDPAAKPANGWVNDPDPEKDWKRNILSHHDDKNMDNPLYAITLALTQYNPAGLLATADSGKPILCANCHGSNALGKNGLAGVKPLTESVHSWHAVKAMDDNTGMPLDETTDRTACYNCHPGSTTLCLRGVMGNAKDPEGNMVIQCQSCHGSMSKVGETGRAGWKDLPACQYCHYLSPGKSSYARDTSVFDSSGNYRQVTSIFGSGSDLYKVGAGHGNVQCEACHGPTHAEYTSSEANDNVQGIKLQGHAGQIFECSVCHDSVPLTADGGPHGIHTPGQVWVDNHGSHARTSASRCRTCHGDDFGGSALSRTATARTFISGSQRKSIAKGTVIGCYLCHEYTVW